MLSKLRVGIICGGCSLEHEISLRSAFSIEKFIDKNLFDTLILWIDKNGNWCIIENKDFHSFYFNKRDNISSFFKKKVFQNLNFNFKNLLKLDVVFPIIHGSCGEDGSIQGFFRIIKIPYVGSDVLGSAICINKSVTKCLLSYAGLPVIPHKVFIFEEKSKIDFYNLVDIFGLPLFVKPISQGSSIGGSKVKNLKDFYKALDIAFSYDAKIMIEPFISGRELECAILGNHNPTASVCGEIILKDNDFYTYQDKYVKHNSKIVIPAIIDTNSSEKIRYFAIQAFQVLNCFGMARIDFFLTENNQIFINEVNTLPGFTSVSMYPKLWEVSGLTITELITKLIELALDRYYKENRICHS